MSIKDLAEKIKGLGHLKAPELPTLANDLFLGLIIVLIALGAFGLGRLSKIEGSKTPIRIENEPAQTGDTFSHPAQVNSNQSASIVDSSSGSGTIVASKSGTKYYYTWCKGSQKISAANRVYFQTAEQAKAAGYAPSNTCKGL